MTLLPCPVCDGSGRIATVPDRHGDRLYMPGVDDPQAVQDWPCERCGEEGVVREGEAA